MAGPAPRIAAIGVLVIGIAALAADPPAAPPKPDPITTYEAHERQGFTVMLSKRLAEGAPALQCLGDRLAELVRVVSPAHLGLLRDVRFWIEPGPARKEAWSDRDAAAFYVPLDARYDPAFGILPEKQGGVVMFAEALLLGPAAARASEAAPGWLLHEVAHALQDRLVGFDHPGRRRRTGGRWTANSTTPWTRANARPTAGS